MALDATHRPLRIPTNFQNYAEEQNVHDLLGKMMEKVLISRPEGSVNIFYLGRFFFRRTQTFCKHCAVTISDIVMRFFPTHGERNREKMYGTDF